MEDSENSTSAVTGRSSARDSLPIEVPPKSKVPTHEENARLADEGKYAELFQRNFWLFWRVVGRRAKNSPIEFEDLFQDVFVNFIQRAHNWDPSKGRFSTYFHRSAWYWMGRTIHYWCSGKKCPAPHIHPMSLHDSLFDKAEAMGDSLMDSQHDLLQDVIADDARSVLLAAIRQMELRDRIVLINYFFIGKTLEQIGREDLGLTRERVRQIKVRALKRLRAFPAIQQLDELYETPELACEASGV